VLLPEPIQKLINALERLPGIGPKSASRLAFFFLRAPDEVSLDLAEALGGVKSRTALCQECFNITIAGRTRCEICEDRNAMRHHLRGRGGARRWPWSESAYGRYRSSRRAIADRGVGPEDIKIKP
jgi:recombination protein RecR